MEKQREKVTWLDHPRISGKIWTVFRVVQFSPRPQSLLDLVILIMWINLKAFKGLSCMSGKVAFYVAPQGLCTVFLALFCGNLIYIARIQAAIWCR